MGAKGPPLSDRHPKQGDQKTSVEMFEVSGSVKWFDPSKGYGFIVPDEDLPDVLLHVTCLRGGGFAELRPGHTVLVRYGRRPNGLIAVELKPDNAPGPSSH